MSWNNFAAPNLGLLVYKRLYMEQVIRSRIELNENSLSINISDNETSPFDSFYKSIYNQKLENYPPIENPCPSPKGTQFTLYTTYPGLLCGAGYTHDSNAKGDSKIGFYFDHTTGQPVIPGSSVKGVIKSIFENDKDETVDASVSAFKFIMEEIKEGIDREKFEQLTPKELNRIKLDIFGDRDTEGKDTFFDAVINIEETGQNTKFLGNDFITPHRPDLLKNPTPLMFLKVLPGIGFEFRFKLTHTRIDDSFTFTADEKRLFFKQVLLTIGVGAKTNVGYGQFTEKKKSGQR